MTIDTIDRTLLRRAFPRGHFPAPQSRTLYGYICLYGVPNAPDHISRWCDTTTGQVVTVWPNGEIRGADLGPDSLLPNLDPIGDPATWTLALHHLARRMLVEANHALSDEDAGDWLNPAQIAHVEQSPAGGALPLPWRVRIIAGNVDGGASETTLPCRGVAHADPGSSMAESIQRVNGNPRDEHAVWRAEIAALPEQPVMTLDMVEALCHALINHPLKPFGETA